MKVLNVYNDSRNLSKLSVFWKENDDYCFKPQHVLVSIYGNDWVMDTVTEMMGLGRNSSTFVISMVLFKYRKKITVKMPQIPFDVELKVSRDITYVLYLTVWIWVGYSSYRTQIMVEADNCMVYLSLPDMANHLIITFSQYKLQFSCRQYKTSSLYLVWKFHRHFMKFIISDIKM